MQTLDTCGRKTHSRSSLQKMLLDNICTLVHIHVLYTCINLKCGVEHHNFHIHDVGCICQFVHLVTGGLCKHERLANRFGFVINFIDKFYHMACIPSVV